MKTQEEEEEEIEVDVCSAPFPWCLSVAFTRGIYQVSLVQTPQ